MPKRLLSHLCTFSFAVLALGTIAAKADPPAESAATPRLIAPTRPNPVQFADDSAAATDRGTQLSSGQMPTPAPRRSEAPGELPTPDSTPAQLTPATPPAASQATTAPITNGGAPITPIPEAKYLGPAEIEVTSFHGVTPGTSTRADVEKNWGKPKQTKSVDGGTVQWFVVDPFRRVEVVYTKEKVASLIIRFDRGFPASQVAEQLSQLELTKVQPVLVLNELGEFLGQAYPERGVMFAFEPAQDPTHAVKKVTHIVLEPITAEPFVLRAETNIDSRPEFSLHDVNQAIKLQPGNARSHWLRSRALTALGQHEKAAEAAAEAVRLEPNDARYEVTKAETLLATGDIAAAVPEAEKAVKLSEQRPHVKARALCLQGDLAAAGRKPDFKQSLKYHGQALQAANALLADPHPAIRIAAKEVLLDAHLGALNDVSWGTWKEKERAAENWVAKANEIAHDLIKTEEGSEEYSFRVAAKALAADVGLVGKLDPANWAREVTRTGDEQITAAPEPGRKAELQWLVSKALYDAMQVYQMRGNPDEALRQGQLAIDYLEKSGRAGKSPSSAYLLGRTYFRMGAIYANNKSDHRSAITWFEKAVPQLGKSPPPEAMPEMARLGDTFVSMGVSYWQTGYRKKAIALTEHGADLIEEAIRRGYVDRNLLATPYGNLAVMNREIGDGAAASRMQELAEKAKGTTLR
jgi:tetratricopeptide (TPR) repeat protein